MGREEDDPVFFSKFGDVVGDLSGELGVEG